MSLAAIRSWRNLGKCQIDFATRRTAKRAAYSTSVSTWAEPEIDSKAEAELVIRFIDWAQTTPLNKAYRGQSDFIKILFL